MAKLSKSKLTMAAHCNRKLWLSSHNPNVAKKDAHMELIAKRGTEFGDYCRALFPGGILVDIRNSELAAQRTRELLAAMTASTAKPLYEAAFIYNEVVVRVDIMVPIQTVDGALVWKLIEIKSGRSRTDKGEFKEKYTLDAAIQHFVVTHNNIPIIETMLGTPDSLFILTVPGVYEGVLRTERINEAIEPLLPSIPALINMARPLVDSSPEPIVAIDSHCSGCEYINHCTNTVLHENEDFRVPTWFLASSPHSKIVQSALPISRNLADIPESLLIEPIHRAMRRVARNEFDTYIHPDLTAFLNGEPTVRWFLDFEFLGSALPLWTGTSPNESIPFQFSLHKSIGLNFERITHSEFLGDTSEDPRPRLISALVHAYDESGPIYTWHGKQTEGPILDKLANMAVGRERKVLQEMANNCKRDDLLPHFKNWFYALGMQNWSLKQVAKHYLDQDPYIILETQNGLDAMRDYEELLRTEDSIQRSEIRANLLAYCKLDTQVMIDIWKKISNPALN